MRAVLRRVVSHSTIGITCLWLPCNAFSQSLESGIIPVIEVPSKSGVSNGKTNSAACNASRPAPKMVPSVVANPEILAFIGLLGATVLLLRKKH